MKLTKKQKEQMIHDKNKEGFIREYASELYIKEGLTPEDIEKKVQLINKDITKFDIEGWVLEYNWARARRLHQEEMQKEANKEMKMALSKKNADKLRECIDLFIDKFKQNPTPNGLSAISGAIMKLDELENRSIVGTQASSISVFMSNINQILQQQLQDKQEDEKIISVEVSNVSS